MNAITELRFIADILTRHAATGSIDLDDPELLGTTFLSMAVGGPATGAMWGMVLDPDVLDGVRPRP